MLKWKKRRKTWVELMREVLKLNTVGGAKVWLEKEALNLKTRNKGLSFQGAKFLIRENLTALLRYYGLKEKEKLKRFFGITFRVFK